MVVVGYWMRESLRELPVCNGGIPRGCPWCGFNLGVSLHRKSLDFLSPAGVEIVETSGKFCSPCISLTYPKKGLNDQTYIESK